MSRLLLAVEVPSPRTRKRDREYKRPPHLAAGVREYWIVDSNARLLEVWTADSRRRMFFVTR